MATIQQALSGLRNPAAMRQSILQRLNINPGQHGANQIGGLGSNSDFDREINRLYQQGAQTAADLDLSEGRYNTNYQRALAQAGIDREKALSNIRGGFANRGMSFSGAQVDELSRANSDFDRYISDIGADRTTGIQDVARRRLNLIQGLASGRQTAEEGYGSGISEFLSNAAIMAWNQALQANALRASASRPRQVSSGGGGGMMPAPRSSGGGGSSRSRSSGGGGGGFSAPRAPVTPAVTPYSGNYRPQAAIPNVNMRTVTPKKRLTPLTGRF